jgi:hypothetical protein
MMIVSGFVHIAATSACVILVWMAAESACPQRRAVPKSLTVRYVTAAFDMNKIQEMALVPNRPQR